MAIRLVAVDVDGTLVTADQRVLPRVQAAAQRALEHGIQLVLCTGRAPGECWYILDALPADPLRCHADGRDRAGSENR